MSTGSGNSWKRNGRLRLCCADRSQPGHAAAPVLRGSGSSAFHLSRSPRRAPRRPRPAGKRGARARAARARPGRRGRAARRRMGARHLPAFPGQRDAPSEALLSREGLLLRPEPGRTGCSVVARAGRTGRRVRRRWRGRHHLRSARSRNHARGARAGQLGGALPLTTRPVTVRRSPVATSPPTRTAPGHLHWGPQSREATAAHGLPLTASWEPCIRGPLLGGRLAVRPGFRVTTPPAPLARVSPAPLGSSLGFLITASPAVTFCSSPAPFCSSSASPFYCVITASLLDP